MILWHLYASVNIIYFILISQKAQINYKRDTGIIGDKYEGFIPELHRLFIIICACLFLSCVALSATILVYGPSKLFH